MNRIRSSGWQQWLFVLWISMGMSGGANGLAWSSIRSHPNDKSSSSLAFAPKRKKTSLIQSPCQCNKQMSHPTRSSWMFSRIYKVHSLDLTTLHAHPKDNSGNDPPPLISDLPPSERGIGVGVDLGTTNSAVAILQRHANGTRTPVMIPIADLLQQQQRQRQQQDVKQEEEEEQGSGRISTRRRKSRRSENTIPSVVCIPQLKSDDSTDTSIYVGKEAEAREHLYPTSTYRHVKRIIGTGGATARANADLVPNLVLHEHTNNKQSKSKHANTKKDKNPLQVRSVEARGIGVVSLTQQLQEAQDTPALLSLPNPHNDTTTTTVTPELVSSHILRQLFDFASQHCQNQPVTRAVLGVPAHFNDAQRQATTQACKLAGVERVRLLREPEAAALAYGLNKRTRQSQSQQPPFDNEEEQEEEDELVLVFDLGGGTFDVSVLLVGGGIMEVVASSGNNHLGGSDLDRRIGSWLREAVMRCLRAKPDAKNVDGKNSVDHDISISTWTKTIQNPIVLDAMQRASETIRIYLTNHRRAHLSLPITESGWTQEVMAHPSSILLPSPSRTNYNTHGIHVNATHVELTLSRREMEEVCTEELLALLRPVREVAIMAGALLPGDARPGAVEAALALEEEEEEAAAWAEQAVDPDFPAFYQEEVDVQVNDEINYQQPNSAQEEQDDDNKAGRLEEEEEQLQIQAMNLKALRKAQQRGRKRARDLASRERTFRKEKRKVEATLKQGHTSNKKNKNRRSNQNHQQQQQTKGGGGATKGIKIRDGGFGTRRFSQIILVGGATRMPAVQRLLSALTGVTVLKKTLDPDEAVALGAAVQVGILDGEDGEDGGSMQVLTPAQAAVLRAMARKRGMDLVE